MSSDGRIRELLLRLQETQGTPEAVCGDCPELLSEVRRRWERLREFDAGLDALFPPSSSASEDAVRFAGYAIEAVLGAGGMGTVYRARDLLSGRLVAMKVVHPHLRGVPGFVERLRREAEIGQRVVHDNVVRTLGLVSGADPAQPREALVTEYVEGQTLRGLLAELGRVPEQLCRHVGHEIARGLVAIHAAGAVHRDLKPENVLITKAHVIKVMDLGVARDLDPTDGLSQTGAFVGSLRYAAPEQLRGDGQVDGRADLFSLGLVLYELATGRHALEARRRAAGPGTLVVGVPRRATELFTEVSPFFDEFLAHLLEEDRDARFRDAAEVVEVLAAGEDSRWWRAKRDARQRASRPPVVRETAMHGRAEDLAYLLDRLEHAAAGRGQVVLLEGEAGIGKSRLLAEWMDAISDREVHALFGAFGPGGAATATSAFGAAFRNHFGRDGIRDAVRSSLVRSPALVEPFAALLAGDPPPAAAEPLTRDALQTAFVRTTQALAAERLTVLVIDDLHFAPPEGRALFSALAVAVQTHRVLLVGSARRTLDAAWAAELRRLPHVSSRTLTRLDEDDVRPLLLENLGDRRAAQDLAPRILEKTDGNPYFLFEVLRELRAAGVLRRMDDGRWEPVRPVREIPCPASIREFLRARLDALSPEDRETVQVAACCGPSFDPLLVGEALGAKRLPLLRRLATLETVHRLVRSSGRRYVFDHHLLHEVVYGEMSDLLRESLHARVGSALEARASAVPTPSTPQGEQSVTLADHLLRGGQGARALCHLDAALDHLEGRCENEAAIDLLKRVLAVPGLARDGRRCSLLLRLAGRQDLLALFSEEAATLAEAKSVEEPLADVALRARVRCALGRYWARISKHEQAMLEIEEAIALFQSLGDRRGEADATEVAGWTLFQLGKYPEARARLERCRDLAHEARDLRTEAAAHRALGSVAYLTGEFEESEAEQERAIALYRSVGDGPLARRSIGFLGILHWSRGRLEEALACYETLCSACRESGDRCAEASALGTVSDLLCEVGRYSEALELSRQALDLSREAGSRIREASSLTTCGSKLLELGRPLQALASFERSLEMARETRFRQLESSALGYIGDCHKEMGSEGDARRAYQQHLSLARELGYRPGMTFGLLRLGLLDADAGHVEDAVRSLDEAADLAAQLDLPTIQLRALARRAALPGGQPQVVTALLSSMGPRVDRKTRLRVLWWLWLATKDTACLDEAGTLLDFLVQQAPPEYRASIAEGVQVHREVAQAVRARGAPSTGQDGG